jgi:hypothetical protein
VLGYTELQRKMLSIADEHVGECSDYIEIKIGDTFYFIYSDGDILMDCKEENREFIKDIINFLRDIEKKIMEEW